MKIAVTCENGQVFQHFGHTPEFAIFEVVGKKIISEKLLSSGESGHGALAGILAEEKVDVLICGGIGGGAINALATAGIQVVGGAEGEGCSRSIAKRHLTGSRKFPLQSSSRREWTHLRESRLWFNALFSLIAGLLFVG